MSELRRALLSIPALLMLGLIGYAAYYVWQGAKRNAKELDDRAPGWEENAARREAGLPLPVNDDLKRQRKK